MNNVIKKIIIHGAAPSDLAWIGGAIDQARQELTCGFIGVRNERLRNRASMKLNNTGTVTVYFKKERRDVD